MFIITIVVCSILTIILISFLNVSSKMNTTNKNVEFIKDIREKCTDKYKEKITRIIDWHKIYNHPFLVERSYKVHNSTNKINNLTSINTTKS